MKKVLSILTLVAIFVVGANAQAKVSGPVMTFDKTEIDYGTIAQGSDPLP
jgi:hypothetical protein